MFLYVGIHQRFDLSVWIRGRHRFGGIIVFANPFGALTAAVPDDFDLVIISCYEHSPLRWHT